MHTQMQIIVMIASGGIGHGPTQGVTHEGATIGGPFVIRSTVVFARVSPRVDPVRRPASRGAR